MRPIAWPVVSAVLSSMLLWSACGSDPQQPSAAGAAMSAPTTPASAAAGSGSTSPVITPSSTAGTNATAMNTVVPPASAGRAAPPTTLPTTSAGGAAPVTMMPMIPRPPVPTMTPPAAGSAAPPPPPAAAPGPDDGDPNKPVVALTEVPCRNASMPVLGIGKANFKVDDRDVIIDYPCNKHEGAPMTFILNLHGTTPVEQHFYQEGYFSAYKYVADHNLIIATPSSVVQQWGNGDDGKDLPYLMDVIAWVYNTLGTKFDIRSMWVGGHSWGAMYTATFGCRAELADKVRGLIIMSGRPTLPACASKMSIIDTNAEMDIAMPLDQAMLPMQHGCGAPMMNMLGNNTQTLWPNCMPGFVHSNYLMLGKMHADFMDDVVVKSIVDLVKSVRP